MYDGLHWDSTHVPGTRGLGFRVTEDCLGAGVFRVWGLRVGAVRNPRDVVDYEWSLEGP